MKIFIQVQDGRINGWGSTKGNKNDVEIDVENNHEVLKNPFIFNYKNGHLIKDEVFQQELMQKQEELKNKPSTEQQLEQLKKENADLWYDSMMKDSKFQAQYKEIADLWYALMMGGIQ